MAHRIAIATGNWLTAGTWGAVDATSLLDSQTGNFTIATAAAWSSGANFTPGAITIDGIAVKIATRAASPSGTMSVRLFNVTGGAAVAGTTVTINVSDIDDDQGTAGSGNEGCSIGWYFFQFAAPVLLLAATNYRVEAQSSAATQVNLFRDATANNMSRMLRTTTTGAPAAGDSMFVLGLWTAAATKTDVTVTMNETANTDYGSASTTLASIGISKGGTLSYDTTAASNFLMRLSGLLQVWLSGTLSIGTSGTPIPRDSTAVLEFDCATTGDFGLISWGTVNVQGQSRTSGKNVSWTLLTADYTAGGTSLTVQDDTGWLNADEFGIASTSRTNTDGEAGSLTAGAGASTLTVGALGVNHGGSASSGVQAEILLLSRNVQIRSTLSSAGAYCITEATSTADIDWTMFRYIYGSTAAKSGFVVNNTSGSVAVDHCLMRDSATNGRHWYLNGTISVTWSNLTCWLSAAVGIHSWLNVTSTVTGTITINGFLAVCDSNTAGTSHITWSQGGGSFTMTNLYLSGGNQNGFVISSAAGASVPVSVTTGSIHAITGQMVSVSQASAFWTWTSVNFWRTNGSAVGDGGTCFGASASDWTFNGCKWFGNTNNGLVLYNPSSLMRARFMNCLWAGDSSFAQARGINITEANAVFDARFENCTFGVATGIYVAHSTSDIGTSASLTNLHGQMVFVNSTLASATEFDTNLTAAMRGRYMIARHRKDGTTNTHERYFPRLGTIAYETTTFRTASPSEKMTPSGAASLMRLQSSVKRVAVGSGQAATFNVYVQKDGSYTGSAPRLVLKANPALGIDNDTVLDTLSVGSGTWEQLTGSSSPVAEEDGVLEAYVDCDGSAGNVFIDDWSASVA